MNEQPKQSDEDDMAPLTVSFVELLEWHRQFEAKVKVALDELFQDKNGDIKTIAAALEKFHSDNCPCHKGAHEETT